jgi:hypothetical protein
MPVVGKCLDLMTGKADNVDGDCSQGSSDLPRYGADLPNRDGSMSKLRSSKDVDVGYYVPRWITKGLLMFLRDLNKLYLADQLRARRFTHGQDVRGARKAAGLE